MFRILLALPHIILPGSTRSTWFRNGRDGNPHAALLCIDGLLHVAELHNEETRRIPGTGQAGTVVLQVLSLEEPSIDCRDKFTNNCIGKKLVKGEPGVQGEKMEATSC